MKECDFSRKKVTSGKNRQHQASGQWMHRAPRTCRVFKPNVREIKVLDSSGKVVKRNISMKYYKKLRKQGFLDIKRGEKAGRYFLMENSQE